MTINTYLENNPVTLSIPLVDEAGNAIVATEGSFRVLNEAGEAVVDTTALTVTGLTEVSVSVEGASNIVAGSQYRSLRVVELTLTTDAGTVLLQSEYIIEKTEVLAVGVNSFQTYNQAFLLSQELIDLAGWNEATKIQRTNALIRARQNIAQLTFRYQFDKFQDHFEPTFGVADITSLTPTEFAALPADFRAALSRAQILEADNLLGGDEYGDYRKQGVLSITVGEAKQFFRPAKPLAGPVCRKALRELNKYVQSRTRIGRG